jgi:histidinol-phosphate phosphatase family protein
MVSLGGVPLLERLVKMLASQGFRRLLLKTGYRSDVIERAFGDGRDLGCRIEYLIEDEPLGTAGGLRFLAEAKQPTLVFYGDVLAHVNVRRLVDLHVRTGAQASLVVHESDHPEDSDVVCLSPDGWVERIVHKPGSSRHGRLTNAGLYLLDPICFRYVPETGAADFGRDVLPALLRDGIRVRGHRTQEYLKDMGTPDRLRHCERDLANGRVFGCVSAVLLDRDGTVNEDVGPLSRLDQIRLLAGAPSAIARLNEAGLTVVVTTNQAVVARGLCSDKQVAAIHARISEELSSEGAFLDAIFYCPHHPETHHEEGVAELRVACECRKPEPGMLQRSASLLGFDLSRSFFVGDTTSDVEAGRRAGARTVLVGTGLGGQDQRFAAEPDYRVADLTEAASLILRKHRSSFAALVEHVRALASTTQPVVVLIGGCARAGKSTLSSSLSAALSPQPLSLELDGWLRSASERPRKSTVMERYDVPAIERALHALLRGEEIATGDYDRVRQVRESGRHITLAGHAVVIVEGVIALAVESLRLLANVRVFVDVREDVRRARLESLLDEIGADSARREQIEARNREEVPFIKNGWRHADFIL